ncbi:hypothetical protein [Anaerospora hongkongensis]|uniref:hypothetical protein n=1 Tax=Anaerospora hongkongensis TaxID=244830 RepID=UPI00289819E7|nr:hypothetical protein [Anaerospora hongkongensis]
MIGSLAQMVSLISYGNHFLENRESFNDYSTHSSFVHCNLVDFRIMKKKHFFSSASAEHIIASSPQQWFSLLQKETCKRLRLYYQGTDNAEIADHHSSAFVGGGGTWMIETIYEDKADFWLSRWNVTRPNDEERKIWTVNYLKVIEDHAILNLEIDCKKAKHNLGCILNEIYDFAVLKELTGWANTFKQSKLILEGQIVYDGYCLDAINRINYWTPAQNLFYGAAAAWVFGGMGSWNDLYFEEETDQQLYNHLSAQLYKAINEAIVASINSF